MTTPLSPALLAQLAAPFPLEQIEVKPGSVRQDGTAALALAYADWRVYAERLDSVIGPANWQIQLVPWGQTRVIARLTICGITKDATGEGDPDGPNCGTIAEAQGDGSHGQGAWASDCAAPQSSLTIGVFGDPDARC
jgi:hypothetical protein